MAMATGCMEIISTPLPTTAWTIPWIHVAFENAAAVASGVESGLKALMKKGRLPQKRINVIGMAGDGGTAGPDNVYGYGRLDLPAALALLEQGSTPPAEPVCSDADGDGYPAEEGCGLAVDCAPADARIHPGACDIPRDGIDQDCDGKDRRGGKPCR